METSEKRTYYTSTDEFFFERDNDIVKINFGPTRLQLSNSAAHDLVYRLAAYLIFLEHHDGKTEAEVVRGQQEEPIVTELPDNVLQYPFGGRHE